jgi:Fic family protein
LQYDRARVGVEVALARRAQGVVEGKLAALGFEQRQQLAAEAWTKDAMATAAVPVEMVQMLAWFNTRAEPESLIQAALAHLWFETIHPFEDGNGRVGRVLIDLVLARDAGEASRLIRISQQLLEQREAYYMALAQAQHGPLVVTDWVVWFVAQVRLACEQASVVIDLSLAKARFWSEHRDKDLSARQRKVVNTLLDAGPGGFAGGMSTKKYENLAATSRATASRELIELEALGLLGSAGAGRSTRYYVKLAGWLPQAA